MMLKSRNIFSLLFAMMVVNANAQTLQDGVRAMEYDKNEEARSIFLKITATEPMNGMGYYYLGQTYTNLYNTDSARMAYENGIKADPKNPANFAGLGELYLDDNKIEDAKAQFAKALAISKAKDGTVKDANALRFVAHSMVMAENKLLDDAVTNIELALELKKSYDNYVTAGDVYLEKNDGGKAATMYEKAIELDANNPKAYVKVANIWLRVKNAEATYNELNRALKIDSNYAPVLKALAEYYSQTKIYVKAKDYFVRYLQNSENSSSNKARYARILYRNKDYAEVLNVITDLQKSDSSDIYMFRLAGYSYYEVGSDKKDTSMFRPGAASMEYFIQKIDSPKIISNDYEYLGKLYSRIPGKDSLAVVYINKAIASDPQKIELFKEAGMIFNRSRKFDKSIVCFESYIARTNKVLPADYFLLGMASNYGKQYAKADSAFAKVNELKPDFAEAYFQRGLSVAAMDPEFKTPAAKDFWEKFISMTETNPDKYKKSLITTYNNLAIYYIKQDNNAKAKENLNKILALDPENKDAKDYLKKLEAPAPAKKGK